MPDIKPTQFLDAEDELWTCHVTTPVLIEGCQCLGITLEELQNVDSMNAGALIGLLWYTVRKSAKQRNVSKTEFEEKRVPPHLLMAALAAMGNALAEAFPRAQDTREQSDSPDAEDKLPDPLDRSEAAARGRSATSANSRLSPESPQPTAT